MPQSQLTRIEDAMHFSMSSNTHRLEFLELPTIAKDHVFKR